jgi:hypothetical protein
VSDDQFADIARRLREEGQATAPADLRSEVMAQVTAEPRRRASRRRRRLWQGSLATAAVACGVIGVLIGLSNLGSSAESSNAARSEPAAALEGAGNGATIAAPETFTVPRSAAEKLFAKAVPDSAPGTLSMEQSPAGAFVVTVPADQRNQLIARLRAHQLDKTLYAPTTNAGVTGGTYALPAGTVRVIVKTSPAGN